MVQPHVHRSQRQRSSVYQGVKDSTAGCTTVQQHVRQRDTNAAACTTKRHKHEQGLSWRAVYKWCFSGTLCIEQGVVLSSRFAKWTVRRAPRVLRMAVVSQSRVKFGRKRVFLVGTTNFILFSFLLILTHRNI